MGGNILYIVYFMIGLLYFTVRLSESSHPLVAIVTFIHDERDILEYWLQFHSQIVGVKNMAVIDNLSPNETLSILKKWEKRGLHVIYGFDDYLKKGPKITETFHKIFPHHNLAIPLDIDEFIVAINEKGSPVISIQAIHRQFQSLYHSKFNCFQARYIFNNCNRSPNDTMEDIQDFGWKLGSEYLQKHRKRFFRLKNLQNLDHGNHFGTFTGSCTEDVHVAYLHYHNRNMLLKVEHAIRDMIEFGHLPKDTTPANLSAHRVYRLANSSGVTGFHKIIELRKYVEFGLEGLMIACPPRNQTEHLPRIQEILASRQDELQDFVQDHAHEHSPRDTRSAGFAPSSPFSTSSSTASSKQNTKKKQSALRKA
jgi:hypothetical protein